VEGKGEASSLVAKYEKRRGGLAFSFSVASLAGAWVRKTWGFGNGVLVRDGWNCFAFVRFQKLNDTAFPSFLCSISSPRATSRGRFAPPLVFLCFCSRSSLLGRGGPLPCCPPSSKASSFCFWDPFRLWAVNLVRAGIVGFPTFGAGMGGSLVFRSCVFLFCYNIEGGSRSSPASVAGGACSRRSKGERKFRSAQDYESLCQERSEGNFLFREGERKGLSSLFPPLCLGSGFERGGKEALGLSQEAASGAVLAHGRTPEYGCPPFLFAGLRKISLRERKKSLSL